MANHLKRNSLLSSAAAAAIATLLAVAPAHAIVPNDNFPGDPNVSPATRAIDTAGGVNGVGMFFRADGFVCSGTLINPRTVLFAAHCVNNVPETVFGNTLAAAWSFNVNALQGFRTWFRNGNQSDASQFVYNVNQIKWNAASQARPQSRGFLEADVAVASLDAPAANIPTWALLFSPLPDPGAIDKVRGTGYHVNITGYGRSGSGTTGASQGIDWRRRAAENMIGALTSLDDRNSFLFGPGPANLPQNLYTLDFDDPNRTDGNPATATNPFDFNLYRDDALTREGNTAGGDSGGPLIVDAADATNASRGITRDLVIGVLSGGSRFFGAQPGSSYGGSAFYQPLFLYHQYIAANNPYRYVSVKAGNGDWDDANHWVSNLDPNYFVFNNGTLQNGFPAEAEAGTGGTAPDFGEVCFIQGAANAPGNGCRDLKTGTNTPATDGGVAVSNNIGRISLAEVNAAAGLSSEVAETVQASATGVEMAENNAQGKSSRVDFAEDLAQGNGVQFAEDNAQATGAQIAENKPLAVTTQALPAATLANGQAGASNFVANNVNPNIATSTDARYFDVTFSAAGTTTLGSTKIVDKFTINGAGAGLDIQAAGNLTSLIDINQSNGTVNVDGRLTSVGDYTMMGGLLSGSGTVTAPFLTNILGTIAPGGVGSTGTLNIAGSAVLASASTLNIDIGATGVNDVLAITGDSSLGGTVQFTPTSSSAVRAGNTYTFLTTGGTQTGQFSSAILTSILLADLTHNANNVVATIRAGSYNAIVQPNNAVQSSYAQLMDQNRGNAAKFTALHSLLDYASAAQIQAAFDSWAPVTETTTRTLGRSALTNLSRFHRNRMSSFNRGDFGGTVAVIGNPLQVAANAAVSSDITDVFRAGATGETSVRSNAGVNEDMAIYLAGGYIAGKGGAMPTAANLANETFDGWFISGGLDYMVSDSAVIGGSVSYTKLDASAALGQQVKSNMITGTIYGQARTASDFVFEGQFTLGNYNNKTQRTVSVLANTFNLATDDNSLAFGAEFDVEKEVKMGKVIFAPGVGVRYSNIGFGTVTETGGGPALTINRNRYKSFQGRAGIEFKDDGTSDVQARVSMDFVHEFNNPTNSFGANFVGGNGGVVPFQLFSQDRNWGELGAGLRFNVGGAAVDLSVDTTVGRQDAQSQTYQAGVSFKF